MAQIYREDRHRPGIKGRNIARGEDPARSFYAVAAVERRGCNRAGNSSLHAARDIKSLTPPPPRPSMNTRALSKGSSRPLVPRARAWCKQSEFDDRSEAVACKLSRYEMTN